MSSPSSSAERGTDYDFWGQDSELSKALCAARPGVAKGSSFSRPQQNYYSSSPPGNPQTVVTQHHLMCGGDTTSNEGHSRLVHDNQTESHESSSADRTIFYDFWREDSELSKALCTKQLEFVDDSPSSSQPQQDYHLTWSLGDFPIMVSQRHLMYGGDSTRNDQVSALPGFSQNSSVFSGDLTHSFPENDQHYAQNATGHNASFNHFPSPFSDAPFTTSGGSSGDVSESIPIKGHPHPIHGIKSELHASNLLLVCEWNDGQGPCNKILNEGEIAHHVSSSHLPPPGRTRMKCQWEGCTLQNLLRRDTVIRHIRQIHLEIKPRRRTRSLRVIYG
ncbi:uncharacterized protein HD556DRAFT_1495651 [Suillus plorans]|uniref:Uncharacterized protein n=1 Tax=Suillus plorans TaxID=116603 RepID=A0A9P7DDJ5_9AGAM|nr:uncharacterized protein HD556DRAFT_1495651 [Suillus plorans]KAG1789076.1 hypothetical protein HD556DRAFT_1495651 [Suillus plorans]